MLAYTRQVNDKNNRSSDIKAPDSDRSDPVWCDIQGTCAGYGVGSKNEMLPHWITVDQRC